MRGTEGRGVQGVRRCMRASGEETGKKGQEVKAEPGGCED